MCGSEIDHPVGLTVVITAGVAFGFVIGSLALDYIRSPKNEKEKKKPKKCKKVHVKPYENSNDVYQQRPQQVQTSPQQWGQ